MRDPSLKNFSSCVGRDGRGHEPRWDLPLRGVVWTLVRELAVTAVGSDRPGIVAAITGALLRIGGNLEDARAALLRGSFATVLAVAVPDDVTADDVTAALRPVALELGLGLWVGEAAPKAPGPPRPRCVLSVYGADHPGI